MRYLAVFGLILFSSSAFAQSPAQQQQQQQSHPAEQTLSQEWSAYQLSQQHVSTAIVKLIEEWRKDREIISTERKYWADYVKGLYGEKSQSMVVPSKPMADLVTSQIYDGARNVVLTLNSVSDGTGQVNAPILDLTTLQPYPGSSLVLNRCSYDIKGGSVEINFGGMIMLLSDTDERPGRQFNSWGGVKGGAIATDTVTLTTRGFVLNSGYSITLEFKKGSVLTIDQSQVPVPPLDFDFVSGIYKQQGTTNFSSILTTTRASDGYADDTAGNWTSFTTNIPRITNKGLLIEEARTNSIRNNSMQGAVAGTPGTLPTNWGSATLSGLVLTIVGTGVSNGIDYIDLQFSGNSTGTQIFIPYEANNSIAATNGQIWATQHFLAIVGGSVTNVTTVALNIQQLTSGLANLQNTQTGFLAASFLPSSLFRIGSLITLTQAAVAFIRPSLLITITNGAAIDFTIRVGWPQLELGAFSTSPIRTTTTAVTRAQDSVRLTTFPTIGSSYSLFAKGTPISPDTNVANQVLSSIDNSATSNRAALMRVAATAQVGALYTAGGVGLLGPGYSAPWARNTSGKAALVFAPSDQAGAFNGAVPTTSSDPAIPTGLNAIHLGTSGNLGVPWNGYIERVSVWPTTRLSNTDLQAITASGTSAFPINSTVGVDLDFQTGQYYRAATSATDYLTTTRASVGYADNALGNWTSFANNVARITNKGLLVEEARTNSIRNNSMQGAVAGTPGTLPTNWTTNEGTLGLTRTISTGTQNGIGYIELNYVGTPLPTAALQIRAEPITQIVAASGQTWTYSIFASNPVASGVTNTRLAVIGANGSGAQQEAVTGIAFSGETVFLRRQLTLALANAASVCVSSDVRVSFTISVPANFTVRIGWPQLEQGVFATSPIRTTTVAVTRAADAVTVTTVPIFGSAYSMYAKATPLALDGNTTGQTLTRINDGTINNRWDLSRAATTSQVRSLAVSATVVGANINGPLWSYNTSGRVAGVVSNNDQAVVFNGGSVLTGANPLPIGIGTTIILGSSTTGGAGSWNGYIERVSVWPTTRLSNSNLQKITL